MPWSIWIFSRARPLEQPPADPFDQSLNWTWPHVDSQMAVVFASFGLSFPWCFNLYCIIAIELFIEFPFRFSRRKLENVLMTQCRAPSAARSANIFPHKLTIRNIYFCFTFISAKWGSYYLVQLVVDQLFISFWLHGLWNASALSSYMQRHTAGDWRKVAHNSKIGSWKWG